jgi:hypothetical protein
MNIPICIKCKKGKLTDEQWEAYGHHLEAERKMGSGYEPTDDEIEGGMNEPSKYVPYCLCCEHGNADSFYCDKCQEMSHGQDEVVCDCGSALDKDEMKMNGFADGVQTHDHPSCRNCLVGDHG